MKIGKAAVILSVIYLVGISLVGAVHTADLQTFCDDTEEEPSLNDQIANFFHDGGIACGGRTGGPGIVAGGETGGPGIK